MAKYRSVVSVLLAFALILLLSLGAVAEAKPTKSTTYTPDQLELIQGYAGELKAARDRLPELATLIQNQDWTFTRNFIHGPYGELRTTMLNVARNLLPDVQAPARKSAKLVFDNLVAIDKAAQDQDYKTAIRNYGETLRDFDAFLQLIPKS
ncbi:MAG TPA: photosystem II protein PsbQ [Thermosynechococcaceae cyanobacterium]